MNRIGNDINLASNLYNASARWQATTAEENEEIYWGVDVFASGDNRIRLMHRGYCESWKRANATIW